MKTPVFLTIVVFCFLGIAGILAVADFKHFQENQQARRPSHKAKSLADRREELAGKVRMVASVLRYVLEPEPWPVLAQSYISFFGRAFHWPLHQRGWQSLNASQSANLGSGFVLRSLRPAIGRR